jgi:hypothetical protein
MTFTIKFRPTQGTLLRILSEITRRGLELNYLHAVSGMGAVPGQAVIKVNEVKDKQRDQLLRAWRSTIDVEEASFS